MELKCPKCSKVRNFRPATIAKLKTHVCRTCLDAEEKSRWVAKVCPHCGRETLLPPAEAARRSGHCLHCPRYKPGSQLPDNYAGGYLLGVILGDGCIATIKHSDGRTAFQIRLDVKSEAFADKFRDALAACTGQSPFKTTSERTMKANPAISMPETQIKTFVIGVTSREWYDILKPYKKDRKFDGILERSTDFLRGFFQGVLDSEGYVGKTYTDIANKDIDFLGLLKNVLAVLGYPASIQGPYPYSRGVAHLRTAPAFVKTV